ncbi:phosphate-selective porin O/P [Chitinophaga skermanii]|uniref:Phosphate-selective porin O/P n=1 Tax=Chitinophaga skermanii TaxID=331697 RepID=A0A327QCU0_9BACT|nr:porin [Chitinophaga skermanii]RAJ01614.1 phosphate-selective porin O/P [Chitinophaga skermanii]
MKRLLIAFIVMFLGTNVYAQRQIDTLNTTPIIPITKQQLLSNVDVIMNMRFAFRNEFPDGEYEHSRFAMEQFRFEIRGKILDKLYFRFRDRYTRDPATQSQDNISRSTDLAYVRFDPNEHWKIYAGKLCADWGGFEFDANPIEIYEYSDIVEYADNFLSGVGLGYVTKSKQEFTVQLLNSRTATFNELYDSAAVPGIREAKFPYAAVANWRGNFLDGKITTIWSYSIFKEAHSEYMNYIALGNQVSLKKFNLQYDFKLSWEQLDRKMLVSDWTKQIGIAAAQKTKYMSHWVRADVPITKKVNLFFVGMVDYAYWRDNPDPTAPEKLRTAWGYIPGIEVYPFKNYNLKVFGNFIGRSYKYSDYAKTTLQQSDHNDFRISVGIISPLLVL